MLNKLQINIRKKFLTLCYKYNVCHIPSGLSMIDYWFFISKHININNSAYIIGNPNIPFLFNNFYNIKNDDINIYPSVDDSQCLYMSPSLGNAIGITSGIALAKQYNTIFISIGDSILHAGTELEAALYIGNNYNKMSNIILCINCNNTGCISTFNFDLQLYNIFLSFNWYVKIINGHNTDELNSALNNIDYLYCYNKPICLIFKTIKGYGVDFIQNNPINWHYKPISYDQLNYYLNNAN